MNEMGFGSEICLRSQTEAKRMQHATPMFQSGACVSMCAGRPKLTSNCETVWNRMFHRSLLQLYEAGSVSINSAWKHIPDLQYNKPFKCCTRVEATLRENVFFRARIEMAFASAGCCGAAAQAFEKVLSSGLPCQSSGCLT